MLNFSKRSDVKNLLLMKKNVIVSHKIQNTQTEINNAAKIFNLGIDIFIFDPIDLNSADAVELGFKLRQLASLFNILFFVKDRCDLAKILECEGIYLDNNSYDIKYAKKILNSDMIFGGFISSEQDEIEEFDYVIAPKNLNIIKPCYTDILTSPKTLSPKVFVNSFDINLIKKYRSQNDDINEIEIS